MSVSPVLVDLKIKCKNIMFLESLEEAVSKISFNSENFFFGVLKGLTGDAQPFWMYTDER